MASRYGYDDRDAPFMVIGTAKTVIINDMRVPRSVEMPHSVFADMVRDWAATEYHWNSDVRSEVDNDS